jgi:hypothetical protein
MASEKQAALVARLLDSKDVPDAIRTLAEQHLANADLTPGQFSRTGIIDVLLSLPKAAGTPAATELAEGTYLVEGTVYQVVRGKPKKSWGGEMRPGRLYAKVLDVEAGKFEYASGAIYRMPANAEPVSIEQAMAFGLKHGHCIHCWHALEAHDSVLLSIGPVCAKTHHGVTQAQLVKLHKMNAAELALV